MKGLDERENLYDYIANEYYRLEKDMLKNLLLELIYVSSKETTEKALKEYKERYGELA